MLNVIGSIDHVTLQSIRGWAYNFSDQPTLVNFYSRDVLIGSVLADEFRSDLQSHGLRGGFCAFRFVIPLAFRGKSITVIAEDQEISRPSQENGDPYYRFRIARSKRLLEILQIEGKIGVEFGPLHDPLIQPETPGIYYADHASTADLIKKYARDPNVDIRELVEVNYVLDGRPFSQVMEHQRFDYAVGLHVAEHVPDLIGWMLDIHSIIRKDGLLVLALPDKRYCFDIERRNSSYRKLIRAHKRNLKLPSPRMIFESMFKSVSIDGRLTWYTWEPKPSGKRRKVNSFRNSFSTSLSSYLDRVYVDAHCWVFTPDSFTYAFSKLKTLLDIPWDIVEIYGPEGNEFVAVFKAR